MGQYWNQPVVHTFVQPWPKVDSIFHITIGHDEFDIVEEFFDEDVQIGLVHFFEIYLSFLPLSKLPISLNEIIMLLVFQSFLLIVLLIGF